ncbi:MAG: MBL fold metallo-hydrolase [Gaiellaceae bacterium]
MARLRFFGGVGVIGATKVVVEQDGWRVVLDMGADIPGREGLVRTPARLAPGTELRARLRLGEAPAIERLFRPESVEGTGLAGGYDGRTALFLTHGHIDHVGLLGWVDPAVPTFAAGETVRMLEGLEEAGQGLEGGRAAVDELPEGEPVAVGPMRVERWRVDHDIPGASGYVVHTGDGVVAYSGDLRLHGRHPELTERFAEKASGAAALVMEGTSLSGDPRTPVRPEASVDAAFDAELGRVPGLVLTSIYPRDIERLTAFTAIAERHGRRVLWPTPTAAFLRAWGLEDVQELDVEQVRADPSRYVVQLPVNELGLLLELPVGPGSVFLHANGEPLGPFQAGWDLLQQWLARLQVPFTVIGTSGHAMPHDLHRVVEIVQPKVLFPVHTTDPYRLLPPPGTLRVLAEYGRWYEVVRGAAHADPSPAREPAKRGIVCVDLDSTLCDTSHRHHLVLPGDERVNTDWLAYSLACEQDAPIPGTCRLVRLLAAHYRIVIVSSRDEQARSLTETWLGEQDVPFDELILGGVDGAPAGLAEFKVHHVGALLARGENVALVIDDMPGLPAAMAPLGVPVLTVRPPYDESGLPQTPVPSG